MESAYGRDVSRIFGRIVEPHLQALRVARFPLLKATLEPAGRHDVNGGERMYIPPIVRVVDDDRDTRDMYEAVLGAGGFRVRRAGDPVDVFEYAGYFHPDGLAHDEGELARLIDEVREARERLAALIGSQMRRRSPRHGQRFIGH
jgi:hypothetical protein